jgi:putative transposase
LTFHDSAIIQDAMRGEQQQLRFPNTWGGARAGAGRPKGSRTSERIPHTKRPRISRHRPHHVTVRVTRGTWNLRGQRCFPPIARALGALRAREDFRIVHFSVQHNHIHMIVEAENRRALSNSMRRLLSRIARDLNEVMRTRGARFDDRYHEHILKTPSETRNALMYVIGNRAVHLARWGKRPLKDLDPCSSLVAEDLIHPPKTWLLLAGWKGPPSN